MPNKVNKLLMKLKSTVEITVPTRKTRFFTAHFTKLAVTPMVFEIPKRNVPHLKDLKPGFRFQLKTFRKLQG